MTANEKKAWNATILALKQAHQDQTRAKKTHQRAEEALREYRDEHA